MGVTRAGGGGAKGKERGERTKGWKGRPGLRGGARPEGERAGAGPRRVWGAGPGPGPAVPLGSSPPPGLRGSPPARAAGQLTRGAEELSGAPRPAPPGRGGRAAIGQRAGPPGPPRPGDIRKAIKGSGGAGSSTAAPPGCERLRSREPKSRRARERAAGACPAPPLRPAARPALLLHPSRLGPAPARPQPRALGRRGQPRDSPARRRVPRQRLGRRPRPAAPSAPRLPGSPLFAPALGSARPGRPQSFPGGSGGCASRQRWPRS